MKPHTFTKLIAAGTACALSLGTALAQDTTTTTTAAGGTAVTTTSTLNGTGTITAFTPGSDSITFRTESTTEPVQYYTTSQTTVVDSEGNPVQLSMLRPDMPVQFTYVKEGDRMVVQKVTLEKPISYYKKTTTTTTTTKPDDQD
ncbi:MAG TPA: hypothetical protein VFJ88_02865 [Chthoniobacterales bacterium]|jgi:hypothetical protein|nr:hypothetical protein [Chthoniobacterales bacterium]